MGARFELDLPHGSRQLVELRFRKIGEDRNAAIRLVSTDRGSSRRERSGADECVRFSRLREPASSFIPAHSRSRQLYRQPARLTIEREPERVIEVERGSVGPGFLPRRLTKGRADGVDVTEPTGSSGRVESGRAAEPSAAPARRAARWRRPRRRPPGRSPRSLPRRAATPEPPCDRRRLLESRDRVLEISLEQFDPAENLEPLADSARVLDRPGRARATRSACGEPQKCSPSSGRTPRG